MFVCTVIELRREKLEECFDFQRTPANDRRRVRYLDASTNSRVSDCQHDSRTFIVPLSYTSRALSLRNLVSGYECGRVFPAGVGSNLPSKDAANWLPSRFSQSVETRQRYGWLRMVFPGARLFRAPIWCPSRGMAARERQGALSRRAW